MSDQTSPDGWDGWEKYFVEHYGPHWRERRCGHNGYKCGYCSGAIQSRMHKHSPFTETVTAGGYTARAETLTPSPDEESTELAAPERINP